MDIDRRAPTVKMGGSPSNLTSKAADDVEVERPIHHATKVWQDAPYQASPSGANVPFAQSLPAQSSGPIAEPNAAAQGPHFLTQQSVPQIILSRPRLRN